MGAKEQRVNTGSPAGRGESLNCRSARIRSRPCGVTKRSIVAKRRVTVILCRGTAEQARTAMEAMMGKLKLTVNPQKTRICRVPEESFDFLGYTLGRCHRAKTGEAYIGTKPSKKRVARLCEKISQMTQRKWCWKETEALVGELNLVVKGWGNYFRLGSVSKAYRAVDGHTRHRLRQWLCHKHKVQGQGRKRFKDEFLYQKLGLFRLERFSTNLPWAKA